MGSASIHRNRIQTHPKGFWGSLARRRPRSRGRLWLGDEWPSMRPLRARARAPTGSWRSCCGRRPTGAACCACPAFGPGAACAGGTGGFVDGCWANASGPTARASATIAGVLNTLVFAAADAVRYVMRSSPLVLTVPWRNDPDDLRKQFGQSGHAKRPFDRGHSSQTAAAG